MLGRILSVRCHRYLSSYDVGRAGSTPAIHGPRCAHSRDVGRFQSQFRRPIRLRSKSVILELSRAEYNLTVECPMPPGPANCRPRISRPKRPGTTVRLYSARESSRITDLLRSLIGLLIRQFCHQCHKDCHLWLGLQRKVSTLICPSGPGTGRPQPSNPKERSERGLQGIQFTDLRVREAEWVAHKRCVRLGCLFLEWAPDCRRIQVLPKSRVRSSLLPILPYGWRSMRTHHGQLSIRSGNGSSPAVKS
jgi:hypothetical protein